MTSPALQRLLDTILSLHPKVIDLSLDRILRLLDALGNPHHRLPPVLHIAGTNGKGSTHAFLKAMLMAAGYRVHTYSSPHLVRFNERIVLNGADVGDATLIPCLEAVLACNGSAPITFFELTTAAAFQLFADTPADVVVLETGLGGRLDATNVVAKPAATIITSISFDHKEYLGDTLAKIAAEKAGIIKPGVPVITTRQDPEAMAVLRHTAAQKGAPLLVQNTHWHAGPGAEGFFFNKQPMPAPGLPGQHQYENAGAALAALEAIAPILPVSRAACHEGLQKVRWPARLQDITASRWGRGLPAECRLLLDGGHNEGAGVVLAGYLRQQPAPIDLILGMQQHKNAAGFLRPIRPLCRQIVTVPIPDKALASHTPASLPADAGLTTAPNVTTALQQLGQQKPAPRLILIAGSLYLAGAILGAMME